MEKEKEVENELLKSKSYLCVLSRPAEFIKTCLDLSPFKLPLQG